MSQHSIVIYSNCQGEALRNALGVLLRGSDIPVHVVESYRDFTEVQARQLAECTLFIEQVQRNERCPIEHYLQPSTPRFRFPVMYNLALWPFSQGHRDGEGHPALFGSPINDGQIKALMARGGHTEALLDEYEALDYGALVDIDGLIERNRSMIRELETHADISLWDGVEKRFTAEPTFHCFYHPYPSILHPAYKAACDFVLDRVGGDIRAVEGVLNRLAMTDHFDLHQTPVHPSLARKLGLNWVKPDTRYRLRHQGAFTFREFWRTYLDYDVDDAIEQAVMRLDEDRGAAALALLDATPGPSPDRDIVRAQALVRGGRFSEAKALAAAALDSGDPRIYTRLALETWLQAAAECKDPSDGERARQLVAQHPDHAVVQYLGGYLLRHIGWDALGRQCLIKAGQLCPADADYANQAGSAFEAMGAKADAVASFNRAVLYASPEARTGAAELARTYAAKRGFWRRLFR